MKDIEDKLAHFIGEELEEEEMARLRKLIEEDQEVKALYDDYVKISNQSKTLSNSVLFNLEEGLKKLETQKNNGFVKSLKSVWKIAAVFMFGLLLGSMSIYVIYQSNNKFIEIVVGQGEKVQITLPDGNKMWINSNTIVKYPAKFYGENKVVYVDGEAFFNLMYNPDAYLIVKSGNVQYSCENAAFNVKNGVDNNTSVTVQRGYITAYDTNLGKDSYLLLSEGDKGVFLGDVLMYQQNNDNPNYLAWKTKKLNFEETPLFTVVKTLSDYYGIEISVEGNVKNCKISSSYDDVELELILEDIQSIVAGEIVKSDKNVKIIGDNC